MESSSRTVFDMQKAHFLPNSPSKFLTNINMGPIVDEDFESILSGLEIPMDSLEADGYGEDWCLKADGFGEDWDASVYEQLLGPIPSDTLMAFPLDANDGLDSRMTNISNEFLEAQESVLFQTRSPISVLKNSGSFKVGSKGRRSKRARKSTLNPWLLMSPMPCTTSSAKKNSDAKSGKEKKRKSSGAMSSSLFKRCTHCEVTKTPQWREGPLGPKTLCNACGVRYRSGRLLPEYRPAASPTFIPSLHSNSHRKVIEMRRKTVAESPLCDIQNFVPQSSYLLDDCIFS